MGFPFFGPPSTVSSEVCFKAADSPPDHPAPHLLGAPIRRGEAQPALRPPRSSILPVLRYLFTRCYGALGLSGLGGERFAGNRPTLREPRGAGAAPPAQRRGRSGAGAAKSPLVTHLRALARLFYTSETALPTTAKAQAQNSCWQSSRLLTRKPINTTLMLNSLQVLWLIQIGTPVLFHLSQ